MTSSPPRPGPATALVTGASGGIGGALARQLAAHGATLVLTARREAALEDLAAELRGRYEVQAHVLALDLTRPDAGGELERDLAARGLTVDLLVNNAGFGGFGEFHTQDPGETHRMLQVNVVALTDLTRRFLPGMVERGRGRVLNVASTAAFLPGPLMAVYYASKAYVLSLSEALNEELRGTGVSVTALCPGPVETGFQAASHMEESRLLSGSRRLTLLEPEEVARQGVRAMLAGQPVVIPGRPNQTLTWLPRLLPRGVVTRLSRASQGPRE